MDSGLPKVLHITADYPDRFDSKKPKAVANLIATADWAENRVISLNRRVAPSPDGGLLREGQGVTSLVYFGLPLGIGLGLWMDLVARRVAQEFDRVGWHPDLIHAHKLTFEGLIAHRLSTHWNVPFCVTVRGYTDHRVVSVKRAMHATFRRVLTAASKVFFVAPWSLGRMERQLGMPLPGAVILPNVCTHFESGRRTAGSPPRLVSLFHFRSARVKNIRRVFKALRILRDGGFLVHLDVIGAADERELAQMRALASRLAVSDLVNAMPAMNQIELRSRLPAYAGLVLPSYPETFGLVYIEALSAGIPVIHARNAGIDGYFRDPYIASSVDHRNIQQIADAMMRLVRDQDLCRSRVMELVSRGGLEVFTAEQVGEAYRCALAPVLGGGMVEQDATDTGDVPTDGVAHEANVGEARVTATVKNRLPNSGSATGTSTGRAQD